MPCPPSRAEAVTLLLLAGLLWSTGGVLIKFILWSPVGIASVRSAVAAVVLAIFWGYNHRRLPGILPRSLPEWGAAVGYAGTVILFVWATKLTAAANAIVLQYSSPLYVALFGKIILRERVHRSEWLLLGVMVVGIVLFFADKVSREGLIGNLLAIGSGISMAVMTLSVRLLSRSGSALESLLAGNVLAAVVGVGSWHTMFSLDVGSIGALLLLGILQLGIPYILFERAVRSVRAIEAVMLTMLEPIANPLWVMLILGERPQWWAIIGSILVLSAIALRAMLSYWRSSSFDSSVSRSSASSGGV